MLRASPILTLSLSLCGALGAVWGLVDAAAWSRRNHYWQAQFYWLLSDILATRLLTGIAIGLAAGLVVFLLLYRLLEPLEGLRRQHRSSFRTITAAGLSVVLLSLGLAAFHHLFRPRPPAGSPSIFLITVDTQRADHLGCYGYRLDTTPKLDQLAESGRIYLNAFSHAPATGSAVASLMSGLRPRETGSYGQRSIRLEMSTMAEYLKNAGYRTAAIVSNPVLKRGKNTEQGFDSFDDHMEQEELNRPVPERSGPKTTEAALAWLEQNAGEPLFVWVHYMDPHGPYTPPADYRELFVDDFPSDLLLEPTGSGTGYGGIPSYQVLGERREWGHYVSQYDAEVRFFDDALADLVAGIKEHDLWDDALVLLTSDHGEGMGEHDYYFAHGENLYANQIHVPLIVWNGGDDQWPGMENTVVQHADLLPTVLAFAGLSPLGPLPGRNLLAGIPEDALVVSENEIDKVYQCSLIVGNTQLLFEGSNPVPRYYDLDMAASPPALDPPVIDSRPAKRVDSLSELCRQPDWVSSTAEEPMDQETLDILRSLGYID